MVEHQPRHRAARGIQHRSVERCQVAEAALKGPSRDNEMDHGLGAARMRAHRLGHVQHLEMAGPYVDRPAFDVKVRRPGQEDPETQVVDGLPGDLLQRALGTHLRGVARPEDARAQVVVPNVGRVVEPPVGVDVGAVERMRGLDPRLPFGSEVRQVGEGLVGDHRSDSRRQRTAAAGPAPLPLSGGGEPASCEEGLWALVSGRGSPIMRSHGSLRPRNGPVGNPCSNGQAKSQPSVGAEVHFPVKQARICSSGQKIPRSGR